MYGCFRYVSATDAVRLVLFQSISLANPPAVASDFGSC